MTGEGVFDWFSRGAKLQENGVGKDYVGRRAVLSLFRYLIRNSTYEVPIF